MQLYPQLHNATFFLFSLSLPVRARLRAKLNCLFVLGTSGDFPQRNVVGCPNPSGGWLCKGKNCVCILKTKWRIFPNENITDSSLTWTGACNHEKVVKTTHWKELEGGQVRWMRQVTWSLRVRVLSAPLGAEASEPGQGPVWGWRSDISPGFQILYPVCLDSDCQGVLLGGKLARRRGRRGKRNTMGIEGGPREYKVFPAVSLHVPPWEVVHLWSKNNDNDNSTITVTFIACWLYARHSA